MAVFLVLGRNFFTARVFLVEIIITSSYNQVQSFQINDYANHYVDIEITKYRVLYS